MQEISSAQESYLKLIHDEDDFYLIGVVDNKEIHEHVGIKLTPKELRKKKKILKKKYKIDIEEVKD